TVHPLHGFSPRYNGAEEKLYCYRREATAVLNFTKQNETVTEEGLGTVSLKALAAFFEHPVKAYYNQRLNIYYTDDEYDGGKLLDETELFGLDHLQQWSFKDALL